MTKTVKLSNATKDTNVAKKVQKQSAKEIAANVTTRAESMNVKANVIITKKIKRARENAVTIAALKPERKKIAAKRNKVYKVCKVFF